MVVLSRDGVDFIIAFFATQPHQAAQEQRLIYLVVQNYFVYLRGDGRACMHACCQPPQNTIKRREAGNRIVYVVRVDVDSVCVCVCVSFL